MQDCWQRVFEKDVGKDNFRWVRWTDPPDFVLWGTGNPASDERASFSDARISEIFDDPKQDARHYFGGRNVTIWQCFSGGSDSDYDITIGDPGADFAVR